LEGRCLSGPASTHNLVGLLGLIGTQGHHLCLAC
jgi:hypothetical protein